MTEHQQEPERDFDMPQLYCPFCGRNWYPKKPKKTACRECQNWKDFREEIEVVYPGDENYDPTIESQN